MTTQKVSEFTAQSEALAAGDLVGVVDVSDTTQAASGTTKKATLAQVATYTDAQGLATHLADTADAHDASAISNVAAGNIVATTVQAAIDELDTEKLGTSAHDSTDHSTAMSTVVLDDISDVTITAAASGDLLRWNGSAWVDYADSAYATSGHDHAATYQPLDADLTAIAAISDVQGDILIRGASGWERLAAGTNGHYLKTQGAAANPTWAYVSPAALFADSTYNFLPPMSMQGWGYYGISSSVGNSNDRVLAYPIHLSRNWTVVGLQCNVAIAADVASGSELRLAVYDATASYDLPGALVVDGGTVAIESTGVKTATISQSLAAGLYWVVVFSKVAGTTIPSFRGPASGGVPFLGRDLSSSTGQSPVGLAGAYTYPGSAPASLSGQSWPSMSQAGASSGIYFGMKVA